MRILCWILVFTGGLLLQCTLLPLIAMNGIKPDILMIMTLSTGLLAGKDKGVAVGFFSGLVTDLASGGIFGCQTLAKMAVGYGAGLLEQKVFKESILLPLLAVMVATVVHSFILVVSIAMMGFSVNFIQFLLHTLLPLLAYNVIFAIPVHFIMYKVIAADLRRADSL